MLLLFFTNKYYMSYFYQRCYSLFTQITSWHNIVLKKRKFLCSAVSNPQDCSKWFTLFSLVNLFNRTPSWFFLAASSHAAIMREEFVHKYPPLSIAMYSFILLSELEQCQVKKLAQGLTQQYRIRTQVLLVERPKPCYYCTTSY